MQADEWPDLTDVELRATALDRPRPALRAPGRLSVTRGSWELADYVRPGSRTCRSRSVNTSYAVSALRGVDLVHLSTALVRLSACDRISLWAAGGVQASPVSFRQSIRQLAGRVPRELVPAGGRTLMVRIDWVAADFLHARTAGRPTLVPLSQVAAVLGRIQ